MHYQIQNSRHIYFSQSLSTDDTLGCPQRKVLSVSALIWGCIFPKLVHTCIHRNTPSHTKSHVQTGKAWKEQACLVNQEKDILGHFPQPTWRKSMIHPITTGAEPSLGNFIYHTSPGLLSPLHSFRTFFICLSLL